MTTHERPRAPEREERLARETVKTEAFRLIGRMNHLLKGVPVNGKTGRDYLERQGNHKLVFYKGTVCIEGEIESFDVGTPENGFLQQRFEGDISQVRRAEKEGVLPLAKWKNISLDAREDTKPGGKRAWISCTVEETDGSGAIVLVKYTNSIEAVTKIEAFIEEFEQRVLPVEA